MSTYDDLAQLLGRVRARARRILDIYADDSSPALRAQDQLALCDHAERLRRERDAAMQALQGVPAAPAAAHAEMAKELWTVSNTAPACPKCGGLLFSIPRLGIFHACPTSAPPANPAGAEGSPPRDSERG